MTTLPMVQLDLNVLARPNVGGDSATSNGRPPSVAVPSKPQSSTSLVPSRGPCPAGTRTLCARVDSSQYLSTGFSVPDSRRIELRDQGGKISDQLKLDALMDSSYPYFS